MGERENYAAYHLRKCVAESERGLPEGLIDTEHRLRAVIKLGVISGLWPDPNQKPELYGVYSYDKMVLDPATNLVTMGTELLGAPTRRIARTLIVLMSPAEVPHTTEEIEREIVERKRSENSSDKYHRNAGVAIHEARTFMGDYGEWIQTVRGSGYVLRRVRTRVFHNGHRPQPVRLAGVATAG